MYKNFFYECSKWRTIEIYVSRPIIRAIQDIIENKITDTLLENDYNQGYVFKISCCSELSEVKVA